MQSHLSHFATSYDACNTCVNDRLNLLKVNNKTTITSLIKATTLQVVAQQKIRGQKIVKMCLRVHFNVKKRTYLVRDARRQENVVVS